MLYHHCSLFPRIHDCRDNPNNISALLSCLVPDTDLVCVELSSYRNVADVFLFEALIVLGTMKEASQVTLTSGSAGEPECARSLS
jgi:hypothetical protein